MTTTVKQKDTNVIPNGTYRVTLANIKKFKNAYGDRILFEYRLLNGATVTQSTATNLSPHSKLASVLEKLIGRELSPHEINTGIDIEKLIGTRCNVLIMRARNKEGHTYNNVVQVFR